MRRCFTSYTGQLAGLYRTASRTKFGRDPCKSGRAIPKPTATGTYGRVSHTRSVELSTIEIAVAKMCHHQRDELAHDGLEILD